MTRHEPKDTTCIIEPHPDFDTMTVEEVRVHLHELEEQLEFGTAHGADQIWKTWYYQERRLAQAALKRMTANGPLQEGFDEPLTLKELFDMPVDQTRWLWDECLPMKATSALVGKTYTGKTAFACSLVLAVSRGIEFLGRKTEQSNVLYVYLDGPMDEIRENFMGIGANGNDPILIYSKAIPPDLPWIKKQLHERDIKLVIIDTAQKFFSFKEDKYEEKINKMQPMMGLVNDFNVHVMLTYHAAKNSRDTITALGSTAAEANARVSLYLRKIENSEVRVFDSVQNAGKKFSTIWLSDPKKGFITKAGKMGQGLIHEMSDKVLPFIEANPGFTEGMIKRDVSGKAKIVSLTIRTLLSEKKVERRGTGKRGDAMKYYLMGQAPEEKKPEPEPEETSNGEDTTMDLFKS